MAEGNVFGKQSRRGFAEFLKGELIKGRHGVGLLVEVYLCIGCLNTYFYSV